MKYAVEMGSGAMTSLIKIGSGIQKLMGWEDTQTNKKHGNRISLLLFIYFFEIRKVG
jgi:hypothetical protein